MRLAIFSQAFSLKKGSGGGFLPRALPWASLFEPFRLKIAINKEYVYTSLNYHQHSFDIFYSG